MNKRMIGWMVAGACLILIGSILFGGMMMLLKWDFSKLSTDKCETKEYRIEESMGSFEKIAIDTKTAKIEFFSIENGEASRVVCLEEQKAKHRVYVEDGILKIAMEDHRKWYDYISLFNFKVPKISLYLPQKNYDSLLIQTNTGDVKIPADFSFGRLRIEGDTADVDSLAQISEQIEIEVDTGDIKLENLKANIAELSTDTGDIDIKSASDQGRIVVETDTGKVRLSQVSCKGLSIESSTGDIRLNKTIAAEQIAIKTTTGDIELEECDAEELVMKTSTGDVCGTLLSEKIFITETSTGKIQVPKTTIGGRCEIKTSTGDIKIEIK